MLKAYKYRIYPNREQKEQIEKTFSHTRYVYNNILSYRKTMYENFNISLSKIDCNNYCNKILKPLLEWLKEVDKFSIPSASVFKSSILGYSPSTIGFKCGT